MLVDAIRAGGISRIRGSADKTAVLRSIVDIVPLPPNVDRESITRMLLEREQAGSTAIGKGIAVPHLRTPVLLRDPGLISLYLLERPIDFGAFDGQPVFAVFLIISATVRSYLELLSQLSFALSDPRLKATLFRRAPSADIIAEFKRVESAIKRRQKASPSDS